MGVRMRRLLLPLLRGWAWVALLLCRASVQTSAQTLDSTAPRLVRVAAEQTSADVRRLDRWLECTAAGCGF